MVDKGLSSSMWATGPRPYRFSNKTTTATSTTTRAGTYTSSETYGSTRVGTQLTPSATRGSPLPTTTYGSPLPTRPSPAAPAPHQIDFHSALARIPTPWAELARYTKIVRRLKWKFPLLAYSYNAAVDRAFSDERRAEAELMFKLDFFEYYMLIERALVHLLGVFGIKITGALGTRQGRREGWEQSDHRFHANVLEALDDYRNPLHEALGKDDARYALARAKERECWLASL